MTTALMANSDATIVVAAGITRLGLNQGGEWLTFVQIGIDHQHDGATTRGSRLDFNESH